MLLNGSVSLPYIADNHDTTLVHQELTDRKSARHIQAPESTPPATVWKSHASALTTPASQASVAGMHDTLA